MVFRGRFVLLAHLFLVAVGAAASPVAAEFVARPRPPSILDPAVKSSTVGDRRVSFIVDGDFYDGDVGRSVPGDLNRSLQALYMNRFTADQYPVELDQVQIFFACNQDDGTGECLGMDIDIVLIQDQDGDGTPQTGAETIAVVHDVVKVVDKVNFSVYDLDPPVQLDGPGDFYVGFIPRFIESGVTGFTLPATVDRQSPSQGRSWLVAYEGDPPDPPTFPADGSTSTVDDAGFPANLKIRAFGRGPEGVCSLGPFTLCLGEGGRFEVTMRYDTELGGGLAGAGQTVILDDVQDGGIFWFFRKDNPEMLVKVLDGCHFPEPRYGVFYAATTTVGFELTVEDTQTGELRTYSNPDLQRAVPVTDTRAFATCP